MGKRTGSRDCQGEGRSRMEKCARFGHHSGVRVLKRREFQRWQQRENLLDGALCTLVTEVEHGLVGARIGDSICKKRMARPGAGKRGGYRVIVATRAGVRHVFLHGFAKCDKADLSDKERKVLRFLGKALLGLSEVEVAEAARLGVLMEVPCDEQDH